MRVISVLGGRPHLVKCEAIHQAFINTHVQHDTVECWLGQVSDYPWGSNDFVLPTPLDVIAVADGGQLVRRLRQLLIALKPDVVLLYGDLDATLIGLSIAHQLAVPIVHIESGYRSGDLADREELIRIAVDHGATHRIVFSNSMASNLEAEGIDIRTISQYGNPALQTLRRRVTNVLAAAHRRSSRNRMTGLVTFHHDENLLDRARMALIVDYVESLAESFPLTVVLYRRTETQLERFGLHGRLNAIAARSASIRVTSTLRHTEYVNELIRACFVLTDSSTVQDECAFIRKPCFVVRPVSPRMRDFPDSTILVDRIEREHLVLLIKAAVGNAQTAELDLSRLGRAYDTSFVDLLTLVASGRWTGSDSSATSHHGPAVG